MIAHLNLNAQRAKEYLDELRRKEFVIAHREHRSTVYSITPKGRDWLNDYMKIIQP